jgi:hypothetical protein
VKAYVVLALALLAFSLSCSRRHYIVDPVVVVQHDTVTVAVPDTTHHKHHGRR